MESGILKSKIFPGLITLLVLFPAKNFSQHAALYINEFMASNVLAYENIDGDYADWIEIYNSGNSSIDLAGYFLTGNLSGTKRWQIQSGQPTITTVPAKGYLILYADEMTTRGADHLGFKLDSDSGQIAIISTDGTTVLDSVTYNKQFRDISYSRSPDGSAQWVYTTDFTPDTTNKLGYAEFVLPPTIDQEAGFYQSITISIQPATIEDTIRYTLDGSDPTEASQQYTAPVNISQTSIFKARSFQWGKMPSQSTD